jgi:serine/threonine-protein kinase
MTILFPGDRLWNRFRVDQVIGGGSDGAWLSALPEHATVGGKFLLVSLDQSTRQPASELLALLGAGQQQLAQDTSAYPRVTLPLLGPVEWIGNPARDGCAILARPSCVDLDDLLRGGPLAPAQVLRMVAALAAGLEELTSVVLRNDSRSTLADRLFRALTPLLTPETLALRSSTAQLILQPTLQRPLATRPPAYADFLAPEVYGDASLSPACLVFAAARIGVLLLSRFEKNPRSAETAWADLAAWASGKRDPARDILATAELSAIPEPLRATLARCLHRKPSRRVPSLMRLSELLNGMLREPWARGGQRCPACGFETAAGAPAGGCICCGREPDLPQETAGATRPAGEPQARPRRGDTATLLKPATQSSAVLTIPVPRGMTLIPGGSFLSGESRTPRTLRAFAIDTVPVSEGDYKQFLAATGKKPRNGGPGSLDDASDKHPVARVSWYEATEFAEFYGKRLPTIYEWEKAARGIDGRKFPFGNVFRANTGRLRISSGKNKPQSTTLVGSFPEGASPYGVLDMVGNVLQWTSSARRAGERIFRAVKGSCYLDGSAQLARCSAVQYLPPECAEAHIGFRCVQDLE